ncbi:DMT family transporter [Sulfuriflexus sp.]|uniref:DMT family transporter n=1 Tax=Sulfuriflexus sp. TaxID=2015443 RepID=UPI0028CE871C|nr:DMT family transporter [Sulfuriflexus sp.]MDT8404566.1 DMT family transporter [Sulfuriflexus sp.]
MASNSQNNALAVFALLVSATLWGVIWYPLRLLEGQGLDGLTTSLVMYVAAAIVGLPWLKGMGQAWRDYPRQVLLLILFSAWANIAFILAVLEGHVVRVLLLFYLSPLWAVILGRLFLCERIGVSGAVTLVLAMLGAGFMLWQPEAGTLWPASPADWYAVTAGMAFAAMNVTVRGAQAIPAGCKASLTWWGAILLAGGWIWLGGEGLPAVGGEVYLQAVLLGLAGIVIMTVAVQYGVTHLSVQRSAVILLFELVAGAISAFLLAEEPVLSREWLGGGLIVLAGYMAARRPEVCEI